jgi:hypothetical protein
MTNRTLAIFFTWLAAGLTAVAQITCPTSPTPNTELKLICLVPFQSNSGVNGLALNGPIGAQLSQLPLPALVSGIFTYKDAKGNEIPYYNLGPIILDRPETVRRGRFVFGFGFEQFNFNSLDGINLSSVPFTYSLSGGTGDNQYTEYVAQQQHISFKYDQYLILASYGLTHGTDVTVLVPVARVSVGAGTLPGGVGYIVFQDPIRNRTFDPTVNYFHGSAVGVGDVLISAKHVLWSGGETERTSVAAGGTLRVPSGDWQNYLGSGAYGFNVFGLLSYKARISPHAKIAYQWNSSSDLLKSSAAASTNSGTIDTKLPGGFQTAAGVDTRLNRKLTLSVDFLGNEFVNSSSFQKLNTTIPYTGGTTPVSGVNVVPHTYTTANLSAGIKWKPFKKRELILYGNVLTQLNNVGLRSDPVPSGGISYSYDFRK